MDMHDECRRLHKLGIEARSELRYKDANLPFQLIPYNSNGRRPISLKLDQGLDDRARFLIRTAVVTMFELQNLYSAILQSDARSVDMPRFAKHFGLSMEIGPERLCDEYTRILTEQFDGSMENLPRNVWEDAIMTTVKGPTIMPLLISTVYHCGADGKPVWGATTEVTGVISELLPNWWPETVQ